MLFSCQGSDSLLTSERCSRSIKGIGHPSTFDKATRLIARSIINPATETFLFQANLFWIAKLLSLFNFTTSMQLCGDDGI